MFESIIRGEALHENQVCYAHNENIYEIKIKK